VCWGWADRLKVEEKAKDAFVLLGQGDMRKVLNIMQVT
jgi:DNA polymerase III delta prime subunit